MQALEVDLRNLQCGKTVLFTLLVRVLAEVTGERDVEISKFYGELLPVSFARDLLALCLSP